MYLSELVEIKNVTEKSLLQGIWRKKSLILLKCLQQLAIRQQGCINREPSAQTGNFDQISKIVKIMMNKLIKPDSKEPKTSIMF